MIMSIPVEIFPAKDFSVPTEAFLVQDEPLGCESSQCHLCLDQHLAIIIVIVIMIVVQGGRSCASVRAALTERSRSSTKGRTPNICYFVAKLSIVAIYALLKGFHRAFNESYPAFLELSTKAILLS